MRAAIRDMIEAAPRQEHTRIYLSGGSGDLVAHVDPDVWLQLSGFRWRAKVATHTAYAICGDRPCRWMHRMITGAAEGQVVDHIDGNGLNNRRSNLRVCTAADNLRNSRTRASQLGLRGVTRGTHGRYRAQIMCRYKKIALGSFATPEEAAAAYDQAARKLFGEFARLNF